MPVSGWRTVPVKSLCEGIYDGPHATPKKTGAGPVFLGISNLSNGRIDLREVEHLSDADFVRWTRRVVPQPGDIVFSYETRLGEAAMIPEGLTCCLGRRMALMRVNSKLVDARFLLYAFLAPQFQNSLRERTISGSTVDRIPLIEFPEFPITVPEMDEQRAIASVLTALDDKIELNGRMNETLEAIAGAIFKSWFVDFDPVRAKDEGRERSLAQFIANAFPGNLVDSELGPIPGGWDVGALYDRAHYINGLAFGAGDFSQGRVGLPVIKIGELKDGITSQTKFTLNDLDPKYRIKAGDILFAWSGSPDTSIDIFIWTGVDGWLNQHIFKIEVQHPEERTYVYFLLRFFKPVFIEVARNKQTTGLGHVTAQDLKRLKTPVPSKDALRAFNRVAEPLFQRAYSCRQESVTLRAIRDALLPKLMSGEIRVGQAEETVEARA